MLMKETSYISWQDSCFDGNRLRRYLRSSVDCFCYEIIARRNICYEI